MIWNPFSKNKSNKRAQSAGIYLVDNRLVICAQLRSGSREWVAAEPVKSLSLNRGEQIIGDTVLEVLLLSGSKLKAPQESNEGMKLIYKSAGVASQKDLLLHSKFCVVRREQGLFSFIPSHNRGPDFGLRGFQELVTRQTQFVDVEPALAVGRAVLECLERCTSAS